MLTRNSRQFLHRDLEVIRHMRDELNECRPLYSIADGLIGNRLASNQVEELQQ